MKLILRWVINALALILIAYLVPGITVSSFYIALMAALFLGIVNAVIRPIIILFTLPVNILTLGLFTFVINAFMLWFVSSFVKGFDVAGFWPAFWGALIFWLVTWFSSSLLDEPIKG